MAQFSVKIISLTGSVLGENQQRGQVAERVGLTSNLLHLRGTLIICFCLKYKGTPALVRDAFNKDRWLH